MNPALRGSMGDRHRPEVLGYATPQTPRGRLTRGGKLAIVNCALWVVIVPAFVFRPSDAVVVAASGVAIVISLPLACLCLSAMNLDDPVTIVLACVVAGVNSLVWGYGISWMISVITGTPRRRFKERVVPKCSACGADVSGSPVKCWACSTPVTPYSGR